MVVWLVGCCAVFVLAFSVPPLLCLCIILYLCVSRLQLQFTARESSEEEENYEWLYRGSTRLIPLCMEVERRKVSPLLLAS